MSPGPDKTAIVTGGARGIGRATAIGLAKRGYAVALADRLPDEMARTRAMLAECAVPTMALEGDVADFAGVQAQAAEVLGQWGRVDVLVNNAAMPSPRTLLEISEAEWDRTIAVNLKGCFNWCKALARPMLDQGGGRIINVSSVAANNGGSPYGVSRFAYATAKAGILGLTRALAKELAPSVHVNAVCPGPIETDLTRAKFATQTERLKQAIPLGRIGTPEDIAEVILFLATASPMFLTGEVIDADGGSNIN